jgi:ATP-binding cassette subfamily F protein uup
LEKKSTEEKTNSNKNWKQNRPVKLKFTYKEQKEYETIDDDIAAIEARIEAIEGESAKAATDFVKLNQLMKESEELKQQLDEKMERWVYLNDLAERIEAQKQS